MCGEQQNPFNVTEEEVGSPPRVRGTDTRYMSRYHRRGITPACAGNSCGPDTMSAIEEDHPRVCGEQATTIIKEESKVGSPPRVRGTAGRDPEQRHRGRITPACAGNRFLHYQTTRGHKDHPRVCGEQATASLNRMEKGGSPPRVRGTVHMLQLSYADHRITPACAGNSIYSDVEEDSYKDHPRVCGEQWMGCFRRLKHWGSPPRVRGTVQSKGHPAPAWGITPACAGNRGVGPGRMGLSQDHPRVCGEQGSQAAAQHTEEGSPPRVRGTANMF